MTSEVLANMHAPLAPVEKGRATRPRVLWVDDDPMVLQAIAAMLRKQFEVIGAPDGAAALVLLERDGAFGVVVSDYRMSGMDGAMFLTRVRERFPSIARIMLTGAGAEGEDVNGNAGLLFRLLSKPCPREVLVQTIKAALDKPGP